MTYFKNRPRPKLQQSCSVTKTKIVYSKHLVVCV